MRLLPGILVCFAALAQQTPSFEVATIRPSGPQDRIIGMFTYPGGRITASLCTLKMLIEQAFDLQEFQVSGGPAWAGDLRWNLEAIPPASSKSSQTRPLNNKLPPNGEQRQMLQSLLADRFHLAYRKEAKETQVYFLLKGDKPLELHRAKDETAFPWVGVLAGGGEGIAGTNATTELVAKRLSPYLGRIVIDKTGITGAFDFRYDYPYPREDHPDVIGLILASVRGLGLKLEAGRGSVETLIVDHAEKPGEN